MLAILLALSFSWSPLAQANADALTELARSHYWKRLMHWDGSKSTLNGSGFFFAPNGKSDLEAEMRASIAAFSNAAAKVGQRQVHPQCAFPERYRFLKHELKLPIQDLQCPQFREFMSKFNAVSATLVFSSAYPNSPGSMFGHTFLRIDTDPNAHSDNRASAGPEQARLDLLDYGVSYAATIPENENPIAYMVLGVIGGYAGQFSVLPYYVKVGEYINSESRDIWEYSLDLNAEQTQRMLAHVWELETNSYFDYYFFYENCAYQLLALLEVARPDWNLTDFTLDVIPGETVKRVYSVPGAVTGVKFRPSLRKKMVQRILHLSKTQQNVYYKLLDGQQLPDTLRDAEVLEAAISRLAYAKQRGGGYLEPQKQALLDRTRAVRATLGQNPNGTATYTPASVITEEIHPDTSSVSPFESTRPDLGHRPWKLGTSSGFNNGQYFQEFSTKVAFHDLMNWDLGYTPYSQINFPELVLRYAPQPSTFNIERVGFVGVASLFPSTPIERRSSWRVDFSYVTAKDLICSTCHLIHLDGGTGITLPFANENAIVYGLGGLKTEAGQSVGFRFGPKLWLGTIFKPLGRWKIRLDYELESDLWQNARQKLWNKFETEQSLALSSYWEIRASALRGLRTQKAAPDAFESKLSVGYYF